MYSSLLCWSVGMRARCSASPAGLATGLLLHRRRRLRGMVTTAQQWGRGATLCCKTLMRATSADAGNSQGNLDLQACGLNLPTLQATWCLQSG